MAHIYKTLKCSYCPQILTWQTPPKVSNEQMIRAARRAGWKVGKRAKCSKCVDNKAKYPID